MAVGYSAAGVCWETTQEAIDAYFSSQQINTNMVQYAGGNLNYHYGEFYKAAGVWKLSLTYCDSVTQACVAPAIRTLNTNVYGSCTFPVASTSTPVEFGLPAGFDYTILGAIFAFSFSIVVGLWLFGRSAGSIVNIFKPK